jgi:hypothetical protein
MHINADLYWKSLKALTAIRNFKRPLKKKRDSHTHPGNLTLCRSYLKPYCMGREIVFFPAGI